MTKKILIAVLVIIIGIQFIPVERNNPPVTQEINAPEKVLAILKNSCYDCHSNETNWLWYSYVAPVSFLVASDVRNGRKRVNFSEWDKYDEEKKEKKLEYILEDVVEGEMPLAIYTLIHSDAKLSPEQVKTIENWVNGESSDSKKLRYEKEVEKD